jgi:hypothetical protein
MLGGPDASIQRAPLDERSIMNFIYALTQAIRTSPAGQAFSVFSAFSVLSVRSGLSDFSGLSKGCLNLRSG